MSGFFCTAGPREEESLATRRSRRSTAGNRMEAALAEMNIDDLMQDVEEDVDFISKVGEEEDAFESDFASTEEEAEEDEEAGEKRIEEEEKQARRAARLKGNKFMKSQFGVSFSNKVPDAEEATVSKVKSKPQRRVSLGYAIDAETGEVLETTKRQSTRETTRLNTQELHSRLRNAENKKISIPKRPREKKRRLTQTDLIEAARVLEAVNIKSHNEYLASEEERRKKTRTVRPTTTCPKIRWRSRIEDVTVTVYDPAPQPSLPVYRPPWVSPYTGSNTPHGQPPSASASQPSYVPGSVYHPTYIPPSTPNLPPSNPPPPASSASKTNSQDTHVSSTAPEGKPANADPSAPPNSLESIGVAAAASTLSTSATSQSEDSKTAAVSQPAKAPTTSAPSGQPTTTPPYPFYSYPYYSSQVQPQAPYTSYNGPYYGYPPSSSHYSSQGGRPHLQLQPPQHIARKTVQKQTKNYVEILLDEKVDKKPSWKETMDSLFGTHVDWENVRVYIGKNRPIARQSQTCPITGLTARYRDPRSGVPYANAGAFRILTRLLHHEYVWSPFGAGQGVFVGHEKQRGAVGVPERWSLAMGGVGEIWKGAEFEAKKEERPKDKAKEKFKEREHRVGERRSSRIAADNEFNTTAATPTVLHDDA